MLDDALSGVDVTPAERRFLSRLSQWDKRNATIVASLLARARQSCQAQAGSAGAVLAPEQLDSVLAALMDAFAYRTAGAAACWDCAGRAGVMCGEHARDAERARAFADLATVLSGKVTPAALARLDPMPEYRHQAAVAS